jgi:hypothetical protein
MDRIEPILVFVLAVAGISAWRLAGVLTRYRWLRVEAAVIGCEDTSTISSTPEGIVGPSKSNRCQVRYFLGGEARTAYLYDVKPSTRRVAILVNPKNPLEIFHGQGNVFLQAIVFVLCVVAAVLVLMHPGTNH